ncbi:uncharacterized protein LOC126552430, partial [Aphis gossypii]|uniref:uncharacterized protein LOC126552430 n=1 Tax=Aphis gossypii TaxID=80765 RepID=UPI002158DE9F
MMAKRSANFTSDEVELLQTLVHKRWNKIECKKSDSLTWKQKQLSWDDLANEFNSTNRSLEHRPVNILKKKWDNLKKTLKQKVTSEKSYLKGTGGGPAKNSIIYSQSEIETLDLINIQATGNDAEFDCDLTDESDNGNDKENENVINKQSTSETVFDSMSSYPGKQNWNDYSPALLKTKISEPLIINIPASSDLSQDHGTINEKPKKYTGTTTNKKWCNLADEKLGIASLNKDKIQLEILQMKEKHAIEIEILQVELQIK